MPVAAYRQRAGGIFCLCSLHETHNRLHDLYVEAGLTEEEIGRLLVLDIKGADYFRAGGASSQHGGGNLFARDPEIMGWLFSQ